MPLVRRLFVVVLVVVGLNGCNSSEKPVPSLAHDSSAAGMMAPNPTVPGGSMANPAISNGMDMEDEQPPAPPATEVANNRSGLPQDQAVMIDVGHTAQAVIKPGPTGFAIELSYKPEQIAKLMQLPLSDRPADPSSAFALWMTADPPKLMIPPHMTPIEQIKTASNDGKTATVKFVSSRTHVPGVATLAKAGNADNALWVVTRVQELMPQNAKPK